MVLMRSILVFLYGFAVKGHRAFFHIVWFSDHLPHDLLLLKMKAYGFSENALKLIKNYLSNRKQCVKIEHFYQRL